MSTDLLDRPAITPPRNDKPSLVHFVDHDEATVALCGAKLRGEFVPMWSRDEECIVCAELWKQLPE